MKIQASQLVQSFLHNEVIQTIGKQAEDKFKEDKEEIMEVTVSLVTKPDTKLDLTIVVDEAENTMYILTDVEFDMVATKAMEKEGILPN